MTFKMTEAMERTLDDDIVLRIEANIELGNYFNNRALELLKDVKWRLKNAETQQIQPESL